MDEFTTNLLLNHKVKRLLKSSQHLAFGQTCIMAPFWTRIVFCVTLCIPIMLFQLNVQHIRNHARELIHSHVITHIMLEKCNKLYA